MGLKGKERRVWLASCGLVVVLVVMVGAGDGRARTVTLRVWVCGAVYCVGGWAVLCFACSFTYLRVERDGEGDVVGVVLVEACGGR